MLIPQAPLQLIHALHAQPDLLGSSLGCRLSAFYAARTLSDLPMDFTLPTAFFLIVYFMGGLRYNAAAFFGMYGVTLLTMLVAQVWRAGLAAGQGTGRAAGDGAGCQSLPCLGRCRRGAAPHPRSPSPLRPTTLACRAWACCWASSPWCPRPRRPWPPW